MIIWVFTASKFDKSGLRYEVSKMSLFLYHSGNLYASMGLTCVRAKDAAYGLRSTKGQSYGYEYGRRSRQRNAQGSASYGN